MEFKASLGCLVSLLSIEQERSALTYTLPKDRNRVPSLHIPKQHHYHFSLSLNHGERVMTDVFVSFSDLQWQLLSLRVSVPAGD